MHAITHNHAYINACMHACMHTYIHACIYTRKHAHTYTHNHTYTHIIHRNAHTHTHRHTCSVAPGGTVPMLIGVASNGAPQRPTVNTSACTETYACTRMRQGQSGDTIGYTYTYIHTYIYTYIHMFRTSCSTHMHTHITCIHTLHLCDHMHYVN